MKAAELNPGTVYAYQVGRYGSVEAALLLDTALWTWNMERADNTVAPDYEATRPTGHKNYPRSKTGYLVLRTGHHDPDPESLVLTAVLPSELNEESVTALLAPQRLPRWVHLDVVNNKYLLGEYRAVVAALAAERAREQAESDVAKERARALDRQAEALIVRVAQACGAEIRWEHRRFTVSTQHMQKIANSLDGADQ